MIEVAVIAFLFGLAALAVVVFCVCGMINALVEDDEDDYPENQ